MIAIYDDSTRTTYLAQKKWLQGLDLETELDGDLLMVVELSACMG